MDDADEASGFAYQHSGLTVVSAIELPEWAAFARASAASADVEIALDDQIHGECGHGAVTVDGDSLRFAVEGVGGWEVEGGRTVRLCPAPAANPRELRLFTLGSAWGALGYQRGFAMWHGSAVARGGLALLFCGEQGAGKSTMAGALVARGAVLVADDLSRVEKNGDSVAIYPSSSRVKLWRSAIDHLAWQERAGERDYFREDKFQCPVADNLSEVDRVSLGGIVVLAPGETLACGRLRGSDALTSALSATLYRPEMLEAMGEWPRQAALAAQIIEHVPVWRLSRPMEFAALDAACEAVEALWT